MRIYTRSGDLAFKAFTFPDGQPHFELITYEREFTHVTVELAIKSSYDLLLCLLVASVLRQHGYSEINLDVRYLLGARMDRAISSREPCTLEVVARLLNSCGFSRIRILDAHSEAATRLIRNSTNILPHAIVGQVLNTLSTNVVVQPDKGAYERTRKLCPSENIVECSKVRDMATGALTGFKVGDYPGSWESRVLIVDDICDGGGTFVGLAKKLKESGATEVNLFVTHGVFSKGLPLEGINRIFTTDSVITSTTDIKNSNHRPFQNVGSFLADHVVTIIPISMKDLK